MAVDKKEEEKDPMDNVRFKIGKRLVFYRKITHFPTRVLLTASFGNLPKVEF